MIKRLALICVFFAALAMGAFAAHTADGDRIVGIYYVVEEETGEESKLKIARAEDGTYYVQVVWMKNPNLPDGTPRYDINNPDPALRKVRADRIKIVTDLRYDADDDEWEHGKAYNPLNGKTYKCYMEFLGPNRLKVRGYLGISLLGRTMYWHKVE